MARGRRGEVSQMAYVAQQVTVGPSYHVPAGFADPVEQAIPEETLDGEVIDPTPEEDGCKLSEKPFSQRLALTGKHHLVNQKTRRAEVFITLRTLQRMILHDLQQQLSEVVAKIWKNNNASRSRMNKAKDLMEAYGEPFHLRESLGGFPTLTMFCPLSVTALKDYDYMVDKMNEAKELQMADPFKITSKDKLGRYLLKDSRLLPPNFKIDDGAIYKFDQEKALVWVNALPGVSSKEITKISNQSLIWERLSMGLAGGVAIIAPVLVMVLKSDLLTRLLTLGFSVLIFTIVLAVAATKMRGEAVVGLVAAYAAILVVFIGVS